MWPFSPRKPKSNNSAAKQAPAAATILAPQDAPLMASRPLASVYSCMQPKA